MWFHFIRKLINVYMHDNVSCAWKIDFAFKGKKERLFTLQARNAYEVSIKKKENYRIRAYFIWSIYKLMSTTKGSIYSQLESLI